MDYSDYYLRLYRDSLGRSLDLRPLTLWDSLINLGIHFPLPPKHQGVNLLAQWHTGATGGIPG